MVARGHIRVASFAATEGGARGPSSGSATTVSWRLATAGRRASSSPSNKEWLDINKGWEKVFDEEKSLKESAGALRGVSMAFGRAAEGKDSDVSSVYEVFGPWATLRAQALEDKAKKIVDIMMQGTPAKVKDDSD